MGNGRILLILRMVIRTEELHKFKHAGGTIEELTTSRNLQLKMISSLERRNPLMEENFRLNSFQKRKIMDHFNADPKSKMTKTESTENHYREALEDENGLEKSQFLFQFQIH